MIGVFDRAFPQFPPARDAFAKMIKKPTIEWLCVISHQQSAVATQRLVKSLKEAEIQKYRRENVARFTVFIANLKNDGFQKDCKLR